MPTSKSLHIAYIGPQIGALSTTFVYRDIAGLRQKGVTVSVYSVHHPKQEVVSEEARKYIDETCYLYEQSIGRRIGACLKQFVQHPKSFLHTFTTALRDAFCAEVPTFSQRPKCVLHFLTACLLAQDMQKRGVQHIHCNFAHLPTTIAMYAAQLSDISFSFLCHAHDIFINAVAMKEKVDRAAFGMCSTEFNVRFLRDQKHCDPAKLHVMRTGLDLSEFPFRPEKNSDSTPYQILAVARLVEKKGLLILIDALKELHKQGKVFHCTLIGDGPQADDLRKQVDLYDLGNEITLAGAQPQEVVRKHLQEADVFVLPCIEAKNKDLDGLPIVFLEAMATGVPVITTPVSGNPELVQHEETGLLVPPNDTHALALAIETLMHDPKAARRYAQAARTRIETEFTLSVNIERLFQHIQEVVHPKV